MSGKDDESWLDRKDRQDKLSWRDQDARRNKSRHVSEEPSTKPKSFESRRANSQAKAALEALFQGKKSKEQESEWKKVLEGKGRVFSERASKYVERFGLPPTWDDLLRLLDHQDIGFVLKVLNQMVERAPSETDVRKDLMIGKLRILRMERDEPELLNMIDSALKNISGG